MCAGLQVGFEDLLTWISHWVEEKDHTEVYYGPFAFEPKLCRAFERILAGRARSSCLRNERCALRRCAGGFPSGFKQTLSGPKDRKDGEKAMSETFLKGIIDVRKG